MTIQERCCLGRAAGLTVVLQCALVPRASGFFTRCIAHCAAALAFAFSERALVYFAFVVGRCAYAVDLSPANYTLSAEPEPEPEPELVPMSKMAASLLHQLPDISGRMLHE